MSYDLHLFRVPDGTDPIEAYRCWQEEQELTVIATESEQQNLPEEKQCQEMQKLADSLKTKWPAFVQFQPERPLPWIELDDEDLQLQITIQADSVEITIPYFRDRAGEMMALAATCIEIVNKETGLVAYDPQLEKFVTKSDLLGMQSQYREMDRHLPEIVQTDKNLNPRGPWWKFW